MTRVMRSVRGRFSQLKLRTRFNEQRLVEIIGEIEIARSPCVRLHRTRHAHVGSEFPRSDPRR